MHRCRHGGLSNREAKGELRQFAPELEWRDGSRDDKIRLSPWMVELDLAEGALVAAEQET
jgi:hypothetical protein